MTSPGAVFRGLPTLTRAYLLQSLRSRTAIFWNVAFPLVWLFVFGFIFAGGSSERTTFMMPGLFTITIISGSFFGVSYLMVSEREAGILRRYRATPVTAATVVVANAVRALATLTLSLLIQGSVGWAVFRFTVEGSFATLALVIVVGTAAFIPLGLIVGSVARDMRSAPAISNLIFMPMIFTSGAALPLFMMPGWIQSMSRLLPATYLVEALQGVMVRGETPGDLGGPLAVLMVTAVLGAGLNGTLFRWESDEPVNRRRLVLVLVGLAVLFAAAAWLAPELRMATPPPGMTGVS